ncbi:MAG TPA: hypothetical protein VG734_25035 [Lacunisphaera sp.]|nr:hypothetical protein [Lacunisphaera sp.]
MPRSANGIGTVHYGRSAEAEDGSYVTTIWFTIFYLPICPLRSERILPLSLSESAFITQFRYTSLMRVPLDWPRIARTYLVGWGFLAWYAIGVHLLLHLPRQLEDKMPYLGPAWLALPFAAFFAWQKWIRPPPRLRLVRPTFDAQHGVYRKDEERNGSPVTPKPTKPGNLS